MRQGRLCDINIKQVVMAEFNNEEVVLFTTCVTEAQLIEEDDGTMFWGYFHSLNDSLFLQKNECF